MYLCKDMKMIAKMKVKTRIPLWLPLVLAAVMLVAQGCPDEFFGEKAKVDADPDYNAKSFLRSQYMEVYYFWRDEVLDRNKLLKPYDYDIYDFFDELLYKDDRWSWMMDKEAFISEETGVVKGTWGVNLGQASEYYGDYGIRVRYIFPGSPLEAYGVTRGAVMTKIAGKSIEFDETGFSSEKLQTFQTEFNKTPQTFTFRLVDGTETTFTASMSESLSTRPKLIARIFQPGEFEGLTEPVGYFHFLSFTYGTNGQFLSDIDEPMKMFHDAGVKKLIVDLRYNGGGDSRVSQLMMDYLAPDEATGKPFVIRKHNSYLPSLDDSFSDENNTSRIIDANKKTYVEAVSSEEEQRTRAAYWDKVFPNRLSPDRIYFICGAGTASASEMVINGLRPYMGDRLQMVGDTTYGKPNGMYVLMYPGFSSDYKAYNQNDYTNLKWVFLPICFFNQNSLGESIPWDGFIPSNYRPDDLYHDFGVEESDIQACLSHIVTGRYPALPEAPRRSVSTKAQGESRMAVDEDRANYGRYSVRRFDY